MRQRDKVKITDQSEALFKQKRWFKTKTKRPRYIKVGNGPLSALSECGLALLKSSLLEEMSEIRRPMAAGRCFILVGGWLELVSM